jgi:hypothetical protein
VTFADIKGEKATIVMILSNHCPYVVLLKAAIAKLVAEYQPKGVGAVGISANSIETHPQDGPDKMAADAEEHGYTFPYVYDATQTTAQARHLACSCKQGASDSSMPILMEVWHVQGAGSGSCSDIVATQHSNFVTIFTRLPSPWCRLLSSSLQMTLAYQMGRCAGIQGHVHTRVLCV